jgi:leucyl/phenylalanyl-tRNA--protein transferase
VALVGMLSAAGEADRARDPDAPQRLLDVQWATDHLVSLGATEVSRPAYLPRLRGALTLPPPVWAVPGTRP